MTARNEDEISLMSFDAMLAICHTGVLLRFKGEIPKEYLRDRVLKILKANPILGGHVVMEGVFKGKIKYYSEVEDADVDGIVDFTESEALRAINSETDHKSVQTILTKHLFGGTEMTKRVLKVVIWKGTANDEYFVYFTMSHTVGDGATLYGYLNMLSTDSEITSLNPAREQAYETDNLQNYYNHKSFPSVTTFTRMTYGIYRVLWLSFGSSWCHSKSACYKINSDYINKVKKEAEAEGGFVSTNDIITSWWTNKWPNSDGRYMVVNLRGKHDKIDPKLAGNYVSIMGFGYGQDVTPQVVRKSLETRAGQKNCSPPTSNIYSWATNYQCCTTNWSSFYKTIQLPNSTQQHHSPVIAYTKTIPVSYICIIYKSSDTQHNVWLETENTSKKNVHLPDTTTDEILAERIAH
eukprot:TRINITY_DN3338_c0_g1_i1.p1 TRINITY_DN3338_c0_g1~~TRINITY_DN3338_c0_g1_i1.p1  ORF type:complete len:408 (+),score=68.96 TRINITY_DN3338_c0_g1_i1:65-1288(+)